MTTRVVRAWLSGVVLVGGLWACVSDDPGSPVFEAVDGGSSSDAGDAAVANDVSPSTDAGADGSAEAEAGPVAQPARIFATKEKFQGGAFGLLAGADAKCADVAKTKGFDGTYRAWMSSESTSAFSRIQGNGPWHRLVDDKIVFQNKEALKGVPLDAVLYDEDGHSVAGDGNVWTGTNVGGSPPAQNASQATCLSWQTSGANFLALYGLADRSDNKWTDNGGEPCSDFVRLLCLRAD